MSKDGLYFERKTMKNYELQNDIMDKLESMSTITNDACFNYENGLLEETEILSKLQEINKYIYDISTLILEMSKNNLGETNE